MNYLRFIIAIVVVLTSGMMSAQHPISIALDQLFETGDYEQAKEAVRNYSIEELAALPDSTLFDYYYLKAMINDNDGKESAKRKYLIEAKKLCETSLGIHSPVYVEICWALGLSFEEAGDIVSAFETYQSALIQSIGLYSLKNEMVKEWYEEMGKKVNDWYGDDEIRSSMISHRANLMARGMEKDAVQMDMEFYFRFYKDEDAKRLLEQANQYYTDALWNDAARGYLEVAKSATDNPVAQATLQVLAAECYLNSDNLQEAEELLLDNQRILEDYKKTRVYRRTLSQLSNLYNTIHNYTKAKEYAGDAKFWYEEALDFSRAYVLCLHRCATLERGNQNYYLALLLEDVAIQEFYKNSVLGIVSGSAEYRDSFLSNLLSSASVHYNQFGYNTEAYRQLEKAIEIAEANNLDASSYYHNLASLYLTTGEYDQAVKAAEKAYSISTSDNDKITIGAVLCISRFYAQQTVADSVVREISGLLESQIKQIFAFTSMEERRNYWSYFEYYYPLLNYFAFESGNQNLKDQIYNNILLEKGLLLRTTNNLRTFILKYGTSSDIDMYDKMLRLRKEMTVFSPLEAEATRHEIERIDKYLTQKFSNYEEYRKATDTDWKDVQATLKDNEIAIEFYNIPEVRCREDGKDVDGKPRYCAVTIRKEYTEPHIIPLCTEDSLLNISENKLYSSKDLYQIIWEPLKEELKGVNNIYFAADRELHKIGIEYAPLPDETIISDHYNTYRLSSTRVLAENKTPRKTDSAVLYGGLVYDMEADELIEESRNGEFRSSSGSRAFLGDNMRAGFKYLPGTLEEVEKISQNFPDGVKMITGKPGTEESFKALAESSVDIIHLATHGFFWTDEDTNDNNEASFLKLKNDQTSSEDWALLRSGLIFSGANIGLKGNDLPDDVEDGVLTALELSNMNLGQVDLVVMSACESGLGETSGEGVFGLQRGFKLTGANSLLMSLWKVDDYATQMLMTNFYKNLMSGQTKQQSLLNAQKTVREFSGMIGEKYYDFSNPRYWAAFILLDALN